MDGSRIPFLRVVGDNQLDANAVEAWLPNVPFSYVSAVLPAVGRRPGHKTELPRDF